MESIWFFEGVNLLNCLCPHKFKEFQSTHVFELYKKGDYIYFENDNSDNFFLINGGKIGIGCFNEFGNEVTKNILFKGDIFGEKSIFGEIKRKEFAEVLEDNTSICRINIDIMKTLLQADKEIGLTVYKFIGFRLKKIERRIEILLFKDIKTRLKEFLKDLELDYGYTNHITNHKVIKHPYNQREIATLIGTSRTTINILLNELKEEGYIDFEKKQIILKKAFM